MQGIQPSAGEQLGVVAFLAADMEFKAAALVTARAAKEMVAAHAVEELVAKGSLPMKADAGHEKDWAFFVDSTQGGEGHEEQVQGFNGDAGIQLVVRQAEVVQEQSHVEAIIVCGQVVMEAASDVEAAALGVDLPDGDVGNAGVQLVEAIIVRGHGVMEAAASVVEAATLDEELDGVAGMQLVEAVIVHRQGVMEAAAMEDAAAAMDVELPDGDAGKAGGQLVEAIIVRGQGAMETAALVVEAAASDGELDGDAGMQLVEAISVHGQGVMEAAAMDEELLDGDVGNWRALAAEEVAGAQPAPTRDLTAAPQGGLQAPGKRQAGLEAPEEVIELAAASEQVEGHEEHAAAGVGGESPEAVLVVQGDSKVTAAKAQARVSDADTAAIRALAYAGKVPELLWLLEGVAAAGRSSAELHAAKDEVKGAPLTAEAEGAAGLAEARGIAKSGRRKFAAAHEHNSAEAGRSALRQAQKLAGPALPSADRREQQQARQQEKLLAAATPLGGIAQSGRRKF